MIQYNTCEKGMEAMRAVVQRVTGAEVRVNDVCIGKIGRGLLIYVGFSPEDTEKEIEWMSEKIKKLRIFEDEDGKMNLSAQELQLEFLVVSQFTLYGDCRKGTRPSFCGAASPEIAIPLYEKFLTVMKRETKNVAAGQFGAHMFVDYVNDGPVTILLEREHVGV